MGLGDFFRKAGQTVVGLAKKATESLVQGVRKTAQLLREGFSKLVGRKLDDDAAESLRETLITADVSPGMANELVEELQKAYRDKVIESVAEVSNFLRNRIRTMFPPQESAPRWGPEGSPTVILVVGVNGSGKTTSIAKLAHRFISEGKKVMLAPADTFRAAAVEQLIMWADRTGADYIQAKQGQDPASVAYQAVESAVARKIDVVIIDTAGRLDNKKHLMDELEKISRVIKKKLPGAPHEVLMVLDGNTGQTAVRQAKNFEKTAGVTGLIVTKLDGTAKGGAVISMRSEISIPVKWIGLGEKMTDLEPFDADVFLDEIFKTDG